MKEKSNITLTSFQITKELLRQVKIYSALADVSMGQFIRIALREKIEQLKKIK